MHLGGCRPANIACANVYRVIWTGAKNAFLEKFRLDTVWGNVAAGGYGAAGDILDLI